ncbi:MAG: hypothetical protein ACTSQJ_15025 [Promethearchaeota archaeon]
MVNIIIIISGIILALIATFCFNLAIIFQKKGLTQGLPEIKFDEGIISILESFKEFFKNKSWIFGFFLGIIGWFPYIIAMALVGILVVQPIVSVGLIVFVIAAKKILNERVSIFEVCAIGMLAIAPILIAFAGILQADIDLYKFVIPLLIFLTIFISISISCFLISKSKRGTQFEGLFIMFTGAILYALGAIFTNILAEAIVLAKINPLFFWEIIFGIFWFAFASSYFHLWLFLGFWGMVFFNVFSVIFYQSAFQKGKAIIMFPILNSFALLIPILAGLLVFHQGFSNYALFSIAIVLLLISNITLSKFQAKIEAIESK